MSATSAPPERPAAAVIILNWNGRPLLESCLPALFASTYPHFDVIVVDNASDDDSISWIQTHFPRTNVLSRPVNDGFPQGMNAGLRRALDGDYDVIVMLNNDVVVRPEWIEQLVDGLMADPQHGIVGGKLLYPGGTVIQHAGGSIEPPRALSFHFHQFEADTGQADTRREVPYVTGAALAVRVEVLRQIGLFDENFGPFYFEEADLCARARQVGWRVVYLPDAVAIHNESQSVRTLGKKQQLFYERNRLRYVLKHTPAAVLESAFFPAELAAIQQSTHLFELFALSEGYGALLKAADCPDDQRRLLRRLQQAAGEARRTLLKETAEPAPPIAHRSLNSDLPLLGGLIGALRNWINDLAPRWYVRLMFDQQEAINARQSKNMQLLGDAADMLWEKIEQQQREIDALRASLNRLESRDAAPAQDAEDEGAATRP